MEWCFNSSPKTPIATAIVSTSNGKNARSHAFDDVATARCLFVRESLDVGVCILFNDVWIVGSDHFKKLWSIYWN